MMKRALRISRGARFAFPGRRNPDITARGVALAALLLLQSACGDDSASPGRDATAPSPSERTSSRRVAPSVVVITLDTTRADALGFMGQSRPTSPAIDRMAQAGTVFTNALSSSPMTLPSHATLLSGQHPYVHGIRSNAGYVLADETVSLAEILAGRGYRTSAEVAVDVLRRETGIHQGFDHYRTPHDPGSVRKKVVSSGTGELVDKSIRTDDNVSDRGIEFLRENRDRRFFLWLHYFGAHQPHVVPRSVRDRFPESSYHAAIAVQDAAVGRVIAEIERLGLRDRTVVVLTADHGEGLGEHLEDTHSYYVYDTTMHIPLVFWGVPEIPRGKRITDVVRMIDVAPTVMDLIGISPPPSMQGVSLVPRMNGSAVDREALLAYGESFESMSFFGLDPIRFVREGRWKYIHKVNPELYDVEADPGELDNRIDEHPEVAERLRERLEELLANAPSAADSTTEIDAATQARLEALGYVTTGVTQAGFDELESLQVDGEDPANRIETLGAVIRTLELIENERYDEALANLEPLAVELPNSIYIHSRLAQTHAARGAPGQAITSYRKVLELDPCDEEALTELNRLLKVVGDYDALIDVLRGGADACPELVANLNNYAWALATLPRADLRDAEKAVAMAQRAIDLLHRPSPAIMDTLAVALAEAGRFDEAIELQTEALRLSEESNVPPEIRNELRRHLARFRESKPIRSPAQDS